MTWRNALKTIGLLWAVALAMLLFGATGVDTFSAAVYFGSIGVVAAKLIAPTPVEP